MYLDEESVLMIKYQIFLILASKGISFLITNAIITSYSIFNANFVPIITPYLPSFALFNSMLACCLFLLPNRLRKLCYKYVTCMVIASITYSFITNSIFSEHEITRDVLITNGFIVLIIALVATLILYITKKEIIGYLALTLGFLTLNHIVAYDSLSITVTPSGYLLLAKLFNEYHTELLLQCILISVAFLIHIIYSNNQLDY